MAENLATTESLAESTTTSSTPQNKVTHTVSSPQSSDEFIVFFSCDLRSANVTTRCNVDLKIDGSIVATFSPRVAAGGASFEWNNVFFFEKVTGKSANFDCAIDYSSTDGTNTVGIKNARIVVWKYSAWSGLDLQYGSDNTNRALPSSFDTNGASVSFTPPSAGNYFILACAAIAPGSTSVSSIARLEVDTSYFPVLTNSTGYWAREAPSVVSNAFLNFNVGTRQNLTASAHTLRVSARNESGTTGTWQYTRVLAFREDAFTDKYYTEADTSTPDTNSSSSYETRATVTTSSPGSTKTYLVIAGAHHGVQGDALEAERSEMTIVVDGTEVQESEVRWKEVSAPADYLAIGHASLKATASPFTVLTRHRMAAFVDDASYTKNSFIIILRDDITSSSTPISISDAGSGSDVIADISVGIPISESGSGNETLDILAQMVLADSGAASEALSILGQIALSETGSGTDTVLVDFGATLKTVSDSGASSEVLNILASVVQSDSGSAGEALSILVDIALSDSANSSEVLSILVAIALSESGLSSEAISIITSLALSDTGVASEVLSILASLALSDTGVGSEVLSILSSLVMSDSGSATEALSVLASLALSESGVASDAVSVLGTVSVSDSGLANDAFSILVSLAISDSAVASEALAVVASLIQEDTGLGSEAIQILAGTVVSDTGVANELIDVLLQLAVEDNATAKEVIGLIVKGLSDAGGSLFARGGNLYNRLTSALYNKGGSLKSSGSSLYSKK